MPESSGERGTGSARRARCWTAAGGRRDEGSFGDMLRSEYGELIECDEWYLSSPLVFPSQRYDGKAVQVVRITTHDGRKRSLSFLLERAEDGPWRQCWMVVGVRRGDYSL